MTRSENELLDNLFAEARSEEVSPSDDLLTRVLADAAALQPQQPPVTVISVPTLWTRVMNSIGGWPALSGVAAAGVAGLWVGLVPPDAIDSWVADALGDTTSISFIDDFSILEEGSVDG